MDAPHEEFIALIQEYRGIIVSAIRRVCGTAYYNLLPDVEQEVYVALWQRWQDSPRIDAPVSYLYTVACRTAVAVLRRHTPPATEGNAHQHAAPGRPGSATTPLSAVEQAYVLTELLDRLSPEQARALRAYLAGFTAREVAQLCGWSPSVARHRIYRSLQALRTSVVQEEAV